MSGHALVSMLLAGQPEEIDPWIKPYRVVLPTNTSPLQWCRGLVADDRKGFRSDEEVHDTRYGRMIA